MRGMAHIGVIERLELEGITPNVVTGCSSGAMIAAAYVCGTLNKLKKIALGMHKRDGRRMLDFCLTGKGLIKGEKIRSFFEHVITEGRNFDDIKQRKLAFVGTDFLSGNPVVINQGDIAEALEKITAIPGITPLKRHNDRLIFDGGTAMLVPAKPAYELGANRVIAVDVSIDRSLLTRAIGNMREFLRSSALNNSILRPVINIQKKIKNASRNKFVSGLQSILKKTKLLYDIEENDLNMVETYLLGLWAITYDYRKGLFKDSDADVSIRPEVLHVRRVDIEKTRELIEEGWKATDEKIREIRKLYD